MMLKGTNLFGDLAASGVITVTLDDKQSARDDPDEVLR